MFILVSYIDYMVTQASTETPVVILCGEDVKDKLGKLKEIDESKSKFGNTRKFISFRDKDVLKLAKKDPKLFFETYTLPIAIDQFQKAPAILGEIKRIIEEKISNEEDVNGIVWLSSKLPIEDIYEVASSIKNITTIHEVYDMTLEELNDEFNAFYRPYKLDKSKRHKIDPRGINLEALLRNNQVYIDTPILKAISKESRFYDLLEYMIVFGSKVDLTYEKISIDTGISRETVEYWLSALEGSAMMFKLPVDDSKQSKDDAYSFFVDPDSVEYFRNYASEKNDEE